MTLHRDPRNESEIDGEVTKNTLLDNVIGIQTNCALCKLIFNSTHTGYLIDLDHTLKKSSSSSPSGNVEGLKCTEGLDSAGKN